MHATHPVPPPFNLPIQLHHVVGELIRRCCCKCGTPMIKASPRLEADPKLESDYREVRIYQHKYLDRMQQDEEDSVASKLCKLQEASTEVRDAMRSLTESQPAVRAEAVGTGERSSEPPEPNGLPLPARLPAAQLGVPRPARRVKLARDDPESELAKELGVALASLTARVESLHALTIRRLDAIEQQTALCAASSAHESRLSA